MLKLYSYFRSSASYRVRIALAIKGLPYGTIPINLLKSEQKESAYTKLNPQGKVPALIDGNHLLTQSLAIIEYLEEMHPFPALLPKPAHERGRVRALSHAVASDIAPLNNLGPLKFLTEDLKLSDDDKNRWYQHWIAEGFSALEHLLAESDYTGKFCHGDEPTMADCVLVPQIFNAKRYNADLSAYSTIMRIAETCEQHPAFQAAHPSKQPDAV